MPSTGSPGGRTPACAPSTPAPPVHARLPRAGGRDDLSVLVLLGVLPEVPDVSVGVLGVPVVGVLDDLAVLGHDVVDDPRLDAHDLLGLVRHRYFDALLIPLRVGLPVDPRAPRGHRPV